MRLEGYEILEIAERLNVSERTVRRHLSSAKQALERLLKLETPAAPNLDPLTSALVTRRFDDYLLQAWIGEGAIGKVYRAVEKQTHQTVAIKFLKKAFQFHPQAVESLLHEVRMVSQLDHPGIMRCTGLGQTPNGGYFIVMDWADGGDLAVRTAEQRPTLTHIRDWALQLSEALHHAHQHGIIHCDLKPSNVLIDAHGKLLLSDFGLARQLVGWPHQGTSSIGGTPAFIAPELIEPTWGPIGTEADVFGLGAILYSLLTSRPPFDGPTLDAVLNNIVRPDPIAWPTTAEQKIPGEWRALCDQLLAKRVSERLPSMIAVRTALEMLKS
jgi:serine/threonine protein kinase